MSDRFDLNGKVTIVTGGARGIGAAIARELAREGSDIVVFDLSDPTQTVNSIAEEFGVRTFGVSVDVTDPDAVEAAIALAAGELGTLDLLFNNAGVCLHKPALDCTPLDFTRVIDINLNAIFFVAQAFARYLVAQEKGGSIVNTASMSGTIVNVPQGQASYNASKAGVIHLTKSLAVEWAPLGIRVNSISPGYIWTDMTGHVREDWRQIWESNAPQKRMGTPKELAGAVIYLLSDASTYSTGSDIIIDGGYTNI